MHEDYEEIEITIETAREKIQRMEDLKALEANPLFKKVILEGFLKDEAVRLVHLKSNPGLQDEKNQEVIIKAIDAVGYFKTFLFTIYHEGNMAKATLRDAEHELDQLNSEVE